MPKEPRLLHPPAETTNRKTGGTFAASILKMTNTALLAALRDKGLSERIVAERVDVDPKSVQRWVSGRVTPHPRHRAAVAELLQEDEMTLWPEVARSRMKIGADRELHQLFPTTAEVPLAHWHRLMRSPKSELTICHYSPYNFKHMVPDFERMIRRTAEAGARIRVITGDPDHPIVPSNEETSGAPIPLNLRIRAAHHLFEPLQDVVEVRQTALSYGRSVLRSDDEAQISWWIHGYEWQDYPSLHLRRQQNGGMFDQVVKSIEQLWEGGTSPYNK